MSAGLGNTFVSNIQQLESTLGCVNIVNGEISRDDLQARFPGMPLLSGEGGLKLTLEAPQTADDIIKHFVDCVERDTPIILRTADGRNFVMMPRFRHVKDAASIAYADVSPVLATYATATMPPMPSGYNETSVGQVLFVVNDGRVDVHSCIGGDLTKRGPVIAQIIAAAPLLTFLNARLISLLAKYEPLKRDRDELEKINTAQRIEIASLTNRLRNSGAAPAAASAAGPDSAALHNQLAQRDNELAALKQQLRMLQNAVVVPTRQQQQQQQQGGPSDDCTDAINRRAEYLASTNVIQDPILKYSSLCLHQRAFCNEAAHCDYLANLNLILPRFAASQSALQQQQFATFQAFDSLARRFARFIDPDDWPTSPLAGLGNLILQPLFCIATGRDLASFRAQVTRAMANDDNDDAPEIKSSKLMSLAASRAKMHKQGRSPSGGRRGGGRGGRGGGGRGGGRGGGGRGGGRDDATSRSSSADKSAGGKNAGGGRQH
jgi:hypothetical protein